MCASARENIYIECVPGAPRRNTLTGIEGKPAAVVPVRVRNRVVRVEVQHAIVRPIVHVAAEAHRAQEPRRRRRAHINPVAYF